MLESARSTAAMVSDTVHQLERLVPESTVPRVGAHDGNCYGWETVRTVHEQVRWHSRVTHDEESRR